MQSNIIDTNLLKDCFKKAGITGWDYDYGMRVWSGDLSKFGQRLSMIGFEGHNNVIDAGSGYGQWSYYLSKVNKKVTSIELDPKRVEFCKLLFEKLRINNVEFINDKIDDTSLIVKPADALFSFSVIFLTNYIKTMDNFIKWVKPNGNLYINSNDIGWYFFNLANDHRSNENFSSKQMAADVIFETLQGYKNNELIKGNNHPIARKELENTLEKANFSIINSGPDGHIDLLENRTLPFFIGEFLGYEAIYEILAKKQA